MPSVTSPIFLRFRTYYGTATNRRFGPQAEVPSKWPLAEKATSAKTNRDAICGADTFMTAVIGDFLTKGEWLAIYSAMHMQSYRIAARKV